MENHEHNDRRQLWELLVTDGHVRAARLRAITPYLITLSIILCTFGAYGLLIKTKQLRILSSNALMNEQFNEYKNPILKKISSLPKIQSLTDDQTKNLPPASELPKAVNLIISSLNKDNSYPEELIDTIKEVDANIFWEGKWDLEKIVTVNKGEIRMFGAIVSDGSMQYYKGNNQTLKQNNINAYTRYYRGTPRRWIGVFKKTNTGWVATSIKSDGTIEIPDTPSSKPDQLLVSLKVLTEER